MSTPPGTFPFGEGVADSPAVAHLRNYSNFLLPRGRSNVRNFADTAAIVVRGILCNTAIVLAGLLFCALLTLVAYRDRDALLRGGFLPRLLQALSGGTIEFNRWLDAFPMNSTVLAASATAVFLLLWAIIRSLGMVADREGDANSAPLAVARVFVLATVIAAFLDLQPLAIETLFRFYGTPHGDFFKRAGAFFVAFSGVVSFASSWLGRFLKTTRQATDWTTILLRAATHLALVVAAAVLPLTLWLAYLHLSAWGLAPGVPDPLSLSPATAWRAYLAAFVALAVVGLCLKPNAYSLHRLYRDRLSKAFLFDPDAPSNGDPAPLDAMKLSGLADDQGPYHLINTAMNVQGSKEANRRGRNADFFMFSRHFVGSDLTLFAPVTETLAETTDMEQVDPQLDLATAMAISGAAVSANMGASTVRLLSPTLALLNIRLGYWLRNPRDLARAEIGRRKLRAFLARLTEKFSLLMEMLNQLDETRRNVYLTDGGHIENLGVYELLKRGCQLIIVVDAEADPAMAFPSLLQLERFARIDLGVRITLPWEEIAQITKTVGDGIRSEERVCSHGPHCAVGRIVYADATEGILLYFKSSLTGDEKDYVLDYKRRFPAFPHETTNDQFFSEEQFECYRALGFHAVDRFFQQTDDFAWLAGAQGGWPDQAAAFAAVQAGLAGVNA